MELLFEKNGAPTRHPLVSSRRTRTGQEPQPRHGCSHLTSQAKGKLLPCGKVGASMARSRCNTHPLLQGPPPASPSPPGWGPAARPPSAGASAPSWRTTMHMEQLKDPWRCSRRQRPLVALYVLLAQPTPSLSAAAIDALEGFLFWDIFDAMTRDTQSPRLEWCFEGP